MGLPASSMAWVSSASCGGCGVRPNSVMSAPAMKLRPWHAITRARTAGSALACRTASSRPARTAWLRAFTGGLLTVITATSALRAVLTTGVMRVPSVRFDVCGLFTVVPLGGSGSVRLDVQPALGVQFRFECIPVQPVVAAHVAKGLNHAGLHAFESAQVDIAGVVPQQPRHVLAACQDQVLHVGLGLIGLAREGQVDV